MVKLVSLPRVKQALRVDTDDDDLLLDGYIEAASGAVINYLKGAADVLIPRGEDGELQEGVEVPAPIDVATIMLVGQFYNEPDGSEEFELGYLPRAVTALLYPLRDPALA